MTHSLRQLLYQLVGLPRHIGGALELSEFDIVYRPRLDIKGKMLADFVNELALTSTSTDGEWKLFMDSFSIRTSAGLGVVVIDSASTVSKLVVKLWFGATNNEAKYEAFLAELHLAKAKGTHQLTIFIDSQLLASQVSRAYQAGELTMRLYVKEAMSCLAGFPTTAVYKVPRVDSALVDALVKLGSTVSTITSEPITMEELHQPTVAAYFTFPVEGDTSWMVLII